MASSLLDSKLDYEQQQMKVERQERSHSDQMFSRVLVETDMASAAATVKVPTTSGVQVKKQISIAPPGSVLLDAADDGKGGKSVKIEEEGGSISGMTGKWTLDGSVDYRGRPALKAKTGRWSAGFLLLVNQGLATLAFFGVGVNLVLFLTRVLQQNNADAANDVSKWTGTVYLFSLVGAFLSDAYWGRYKTCMVFQSIFVLGLVTLSACSYLFLIRPKGCGGNGSSGKEGPSSSSVAVVAVVLCEQHSAWQVGMFYFAVYLVALGYGGYQPNIATFGSDQFDGDDPRESHSKIAFFSYFYLALNLGSLFSNTVLSYVEDEGLWSLGFWVSAASAFLALLLFSVGTPWYRHFRPVGNPLTRVCQVIVAASRKYWLIKAKLPTADGLYEEGQHGSSFHYTTTDSCNPSSMDDNNSGRKLLHTNGFRFLDRAAVPVGPEDFMGLNHPNDHSQEEKSKKNYSCNSGRTISANTSGAIVAVAVVDPWKLCTVTQVEEVKCVLRLMPIWLCTILYSVVFTQMASLFVEQGDSMRLDIGNGFRIPAASMSAFDILSVALFIFLYRRVIDPLVCQFNKHRGGKGGGGLTELQRMGVGLVIAIAAMMAAGIVEHYRLKHKGDGLHSTSSSLSVLWQIPQYALIGASEVFMYVGQLEFFNSQTPEGLKSFGSALCMTSISLGNYVSSVIVTIVMKVTATTTTGTTTSKASPGWIPDNLNLGHLDSFYYLLGILTTLDLVVYLFCAKWYTPIRQAILLENNTISTTTNSSSSNSPSSSSTTSSCSSP